jgi:hypothetical protein
VAVVDEVMLVRVRTALALVVSSAAHVAVILAAARGASAAHPPSTDPLPGPDPWVGETFEVGLAGTPAAAGPIEIEAPAAAAAPEPAAAAPTAPARIPRTEHAPRPKHTPRSSSSESSQASSVKSTGDGAGSGSGPAPGQFGMQGTGHAGPRDLARAFTRAIPVAVSGDPVWATLPLGPGGSFDLKIVLGEDGRIAAATPDRPVAEPLRVVAARTVALLGAGTFAIKAEPGAGMEVLRISVSISNTDTAPPDDRSTAGAYGLGFEPPAGAAPGKAHFTLRSGRHIEITVRVVSSS